MPPGVTTDLFNTANGNTAQGVTVDEGPVLPDDANALFQIPSNPRSIFVDYLVANRYEQDPHRYMTGLTSPNGFNGSGVAFFQLATNTILWVADWTAYKWGDIPEIPDPTPADDNWILLGIFPGESAMMTVGADGVTGRFRLSGIYVYGHVNPPANLWELVTFGKPPWLRGGVLPRRITQVKLQHGIIDDAEGGGNQQHEIHAGIL